MRHKHLLLFLGLLFFSCSPRYQTYLTLIPQEFDAEEATGKESITLEKNNIILQSTFLQATEYDLLFNLKIANHSRESVDITPAQFTYQALDEEKVRITQTSAFDPDDLVFELTESIEADEKAKREAKIFGWFLFGINAIAAVSSFSDGFDEAGIDHTIDAGLSLAATHIESSIINKHIVKLEGQRDYYDYAALRDTTLYPGQQVEGLVIFPRFDPAFQLKTIFPLNDHAFEITYDQFWETVDLKPKKN